MKTILLTKIVQGKDVVWWKDGNLQFPLVKDRGLQTKLYIDILNKLKNGQ